MPRGGLLRLDARADGDTVELTISDSGSGVPAEVAERLFEPLVSTKPLGLGLGLATARTLVQRQGGTIGCDSEEGAGTRFRVRLPTGAQ